MKILVVGLGGIGQRHIRNLRTLMGDQVEILAYRSRRLKHLITDKLEIKPRADVEERFNIRVFKDLSEAIFQKPSAALICNPSSLHIPVALAVAKEGVNLFIEKPLSHTNEGVSELLAIAAQRKLVTIVGYQMRFHPCLLFLRGLLAKGAVGRVLAARIEIGSYLPTFHTYEDYRQMYASRRELGGGVILSQIHEIDYIFWLFGMPRRVFALGGKLSSLEIDVEDVASILLEHVVDDHRVVVSLHQDFIQRPPRRTCEVIGDAGKVHVDFEALTGCHFNRSGEIEERVEFKVFQRNQLFLDEMRHFLSCLKGDEKPMVTLEDGAQSLCIALAAKESLKTGKVIEVVQEMN